MSLVIHTARRAGSHDVIIDAWVRFDGDLVTHAGRGDSWRELADDATETTDAAGRWLVPGFVDLHCHGAGGASFDEGPDAIATALDVHRRHGATRSLLSLVSAPVDALVERLAVIRDAARADPRVLGSHLEGPFLQPEFRGAHDPAALAVPDAASVDRLLEAADGTLRMITIAPELPGALDAVRRLVASGVTVAVGHTAATFDEALAAFDAGASVLTHAFNAMPGIHHRAPGPIAAAMRESHVTLEIIHDGVHVHPEVARLAFQGAPGRVALVTDAMSATGMGDGDAVLGGLEVVVADGVARLRSNGAIAGSTLTLDEAVRRTVLDCRIDPVQAIDAATVAPAAAIGRSVDLGRLEPGCAADAVLLDDALRVERVFSRGHPLD
ncbi:N-acetylglucosamine-6-phosphate deacetylase [Agromyces rhizosphaerae]|uniref:N-acetylglucosamine-6-phosphate deacetylase n=1 Tax=Agromyces rhizosphaerae TaxID=88374 RepID=A0A9W6FQ24_9MICO|nr:N-acetylglucosamine-6-phosphate deacetylase [Agromyces rhizosphaerae]GLI28080.1 N-acetylglucosamine-6-phosphate deacetylase [Agromyces rhizosphaerae]